MKIKNFIWICLFVFLIGSITSAEAKSTYKIKKDGTIQTGGRASSSKVPKGTPTEPSGVANKQSTKNKTDYKTYEEMDAKPLYKSWTTIKAYNKVNAVGTRLLEASDINEDIVFSVRSSREANAYTNVADEIVLYTGILKYVETEDELAAVIAHELGHVLNNDVKRKIARQVLLNLAGVPQQVASKKDRNAEYKADLTAADLMVNAEYNPLAEISLLNKISGHYVDITSSHPTGRKRLNALYTYINKNYPQYIQDGYPTVSYKRALKIIGEE
ncbi:M48 family metallopeptidase [bacterium]|nr:M48 family metallopeptidase [bacterium]